jgi:hypothetical protein
MATTDGPFGEMFRQFTQPTTAPSRTNKNVAGARVTEVQP